ncbi:MAG: SufD family Fe-S cluster assembly protein, partial [Betaproteobacteria bacterium]|nr:SufD family Fe-S cluster assembly protein [Betaproteobacteria bacterium]
MNTVRVPATIAEGYLESLLAGQPRLPASPLAWLNKLRADAVDRVGVLTVPTLRDEEWRFTDISPLTKLSFHPASEPARLHPADIERFYIEEANTRLVFVDGVYAPQLSSVAADGVVVANLGASATDRVIAAHLGQHATFHDNVFAALNTAFLHDAALIMVPHNMTAGASVHLLFIATQREAASYPRCLLLAESGSAVTLIEDYVALQEAAYFTNAVTEIALADNARVDHIRVQREGAQAFHIANCAVSLARASRYHSVSVALGARISRYDLNVLQTAEGTQCTVDGLALIANNQLADTHTCIDHAQPHGVSRQQHKCIIGGSAHAVFNGKIMVRPGAQRTDSSQASH